jgi:hypothetical protein
MMLMKSVTVQVQLFCLVLTTVSLHGMEQSTGLLTPTTHIKPIPIPRIQGTVHTIVIREYTKGTLINLSALPHREQRKVLNEQIARAQMLSRLYINARRIADDPVVKEAVAYWNNEHTVCTAKLEALKATQE